MWALPARGRVRMRMKARTQLKALGKQDGFGEAAPPSAGKHKQRQQGEKTRGKGEITRQRTQVRFGLLGTSHIQSGLYWAPSRACHNERGLVGTARPSAEFGTCHIDVTPQCGNGSARAALGAMAQTDAGDGTGSDSRQRILAGTKQSCTDRLRLCCCLQSCCTAQEMPRGHS